MEMLEVDVKVFITCRLCLEEPGVYPIIPSIKEDIKYCFDIEIEPFDGLPQLICKKCKLILSEYHTLKNTFLKKQQQLREKCVKQTVDATTNALPDIVTCEKTDDSRETTSTSPVAPVTPVTPVAAVATETSPAPDVPQHDPKQAHVLLKKDYDEHFVCKICSKSFLKLAFIKKHLSNSHKKIFNKYKSIFKKSCSVLLNKIDDKENCMGQVNVVVYNKEKIITNRSNSQYHSFYLKKDIRSECESFPKESKSKPIKRSGVLLDSSEDEIRSGKRRKSRRLFSCSSTRTTVIEEKNAGGGEISNNIVDSDAVHDPKDTEVGVTECINIDDTSSDAPSKDKLAPERSMVLRQKLDKAKISDFKAIKNIVTMCQKKYIKKVQLDNATSNKNTFSEPSLKHKVLSLGRKVIHKQGFGCTGLLRYMEHKDLEIIWQPTSYAIQNKGSNCVRIMPKLKPREVSDNDDSAWIDLHEISFCSDPDHSDVVNNSNLLENRCETATINTVNEDDLAVTAQEEQVQIDCVLGADSALNDKIIDTEMLNESPVADPKQLPENNKVSENKPANVQENDVDTEVTEQCKESTQLINAKAKDAKMLMPIITETLSLATGNEKDKTSDIVINKQVPRIKVKPASELMSESAYNNQDASDDTWAFNKSNIGLPYRSPSPVAGCSHADPQPSDAPEAGVSGPSTSADVPPAAETNRRAARDKHLEYVTLHTSELPNTKTKSPFQYFKTLLLYHGLFLLDLNEELPENFYCLVKFKLLLKQNTKQPLGVVLSLYCSENNFCFTFKDSILRNFDPNQLPAFWQWELLKIYKSEVVEKILQNAAIIGKSICDYTKNFLCLLKSIECIKENNS